ncbi:hypothetical protein ISP17_11345 [Dyella ginsengisoli]|uniref:Uncharacterized protein n=1 Tax=Dyella ginsengisoli TaxID=363848 RepID=A0ABW8JTT7_9GAMM
MVKKGLIECYVTEAPAMPARVAIEQIQRILSEGATPEQVAAAMAAVQQPAVPRQGSLPL